MNITIRQTVVMISLLTFLSLLFEDHAKAQIITANKFNFVISGETGVVTGYERHYHNIEAGGTAQMQYGLSGKVAITLTSGYYNFLSKNYFAIYSNPSGLASYTADSGNFGIIPVKAGIKIFVSNHLYVSNEAGWGQETANTRIVNDAYNTYYYVPEYKQKKFIFSAGMGYALKYVDVGLHYETFSGTDKNSDTFISYGFLGLSVACKL